MAPAGCPGRAIAAAWAPGGERRELWLCHKIWPEIWSPSDYGGHVSRGDTYQGHFCSSAACSCHACLPVEHPLRCRWSLWGAALVAVELNYVNEEMIRSTNLARLLPRSEMRLPL